LLSAFADYEGRIGGATIDMKDGTMYPEIALDNWFVRNLSSLKTIIRIIFGVFWAIDGGLKFAPGFVDSFSSMIKDAASGQPSWLAGWFSFWASITSSNPSFYVYSTGLIELALGLGIIFGFLRKPVYIISLLLSLIIWSVPEGFGGPYGPGSSDIGTGIVYAIVAFMLLIINATFGPSRYSLDFLIEGKWRWWKKIAEIKG
jgi:thiosulfate dehydrogenase (quinone) large subunit